MNHQELQQRVNQIYEQLEQSSRSETPFVHYDPIKKQFLMAVTGDQAQHWQQVMWHLDYLRRKGQ